MNRNTRAIFQGLSLGLLFCLDFSGESAQAVVQSFFPDTPMKHDAATIARSGPAVWKRVIERRSLNGV